MIVITFRVWKSNKSINFICDKNSRFDFFHCNLDNDLNNLSMFTFNKYKDYLYKI